MIRPQFLFDSNAIYRLIREQPDKARVKLTSGTTINLAYYELGNALWRESRLLNTISIEEAEKLLGIMYAVLSRMKITEVNDEIGNDILQTAYRFNVTFYDSAYLSEAKKSHETLVTDDKKLAKTADNLGVEVVSSQDVCAE